MKTDVKHIAKLAMLELSGQEIKMYEKQFEEILNLVSQLEQTDTSAAGESKDNTPLVLREDKPVPFADNTIFWNNVPEKEYNLVKVKKVL